MPKMFASSDEDRDLCESPEGEEETTAAPTTFLNVDFDNYLVHDSQRNSLAAKQSPPISSSITTTSHWFNQQRDREYLILENRGSVRPRSTSLTDNIEFFRTKRNSVAGLPARNLVRHVTSPSDCHVCGVCIQMVSNYACVKDRLLVPVKSFSTAKVSVRMRKYAKREL